MKSRDIWVNMKREMFECVKNGGSRHWFYFWTLYFLWLYNIAAKCTIICASWKYFRNCISFEFYCPRWRMVSRKYTVVTYINKFLTTVIIWIVVHVDIYETRVFIGIGFQSVSCWIIVHLSSENDRRNNMKIGMAEWNFLIFDISYMSVGQRGLAKKISKSFEILCLVTSY